MSKQQKQEQLQQQVAQQNVNMQFTVAPKHEDLIAFERGIIDLATSIIQSANSAYAQLDAAESCRKSCEHFAAQGGDTKTARTMQRKAVRSAIDAASSSMESVIATAKSISQHACLLQEAYREVWASFIQEEE